MTRISSHLKYDTFFMTIKFIIFCVFSINWYPKQIRVKRLNSFTLSLEMAPATSKWKKIENSIIFISASKKCSRASKGIVEIKKRSKWKKLRWDCQFKFNFSLFYFSATSSPFHFTCWDLCWLALNQVIAIEKPVPTPGVHQSSNLREYRLQSGKKLRIRFTLYLPPGEVLKKDPLNLLRIWTRLQFWTTGRHWGSF